MAVGHSIWQVEAAVAKRPPGEARWACLAEALHHAKVRALAGYQRERERERECVCG
jgi:hypothetical protein